MFKRLEELKKQGLEKWQNFENHLLESNTFNILKERYQSLDLFQQKLIKYLSSLSIILILSYFPLSYLLSSLSYWKEMKEKQNLSLELLQVRNRISFSAFPYSQNQLKSQIENIIRKYSTSSFQLQDKRRSLQPGSSIYQIDYDIHLKHLNVKQAIKLGTELHNLYQARLSSITMTENKDFPKHYDVAYQVSSFVGKKTNPLSRPLRGQKPLPTLKKPISESKKLKPKPFQRSRPTLKQKPLKPKSPKDQSLRKDNRRKNKTSPLNNTNKKPEDTEGDVILHL